MVTLKEDKFKLHNIPIYEDEYADDDIPETADQKYTSAATSINSSKLPAVYRLIKDYIKPGMIGLDIGGGKFDNAVEELAKSDIQLYVYDPYNRSSSHNNDALSAIRKNGGADFVVNSNVLNVIAEPEARQSVIRNCYKYLKTGGTAYFTVYEGDKSGQGRETKAGYQLNKGTGDYVEEIENVFSNVSKKGKLIVATK